MVRAFYSENHHGPKFQLYTLQLQIVFSKYSFHNNSIGEGRDELHARAFLIGQKKKQSENLRVIREVSEAGVVPE